MGNNGFNHGMGNKRSTVSGYSLLDNVWNRDPFDNNKILRRVFNLVGIGSILLYTYTVIYNWIVLNIVPSETKDLVFWVIGGLYLTVKLCGYIIRLTENKKNKAHQREMERMDRELRQIEVEERRKGIENSQAKGRRKDFDDNQITG